jgi:hypothetical protein
MDRPSFSFSFELYYQGKPPKPCLAGLLRLVVRFSEKPLAVPTFTVQNGGASFE